MFAKRIKSNATNATKTFKSKKNQFNSNEALKKLIEKQPYLSEEETSLKHELEVLVRKCSDLYDSFVQNIKTKRQIIRQMERSLNLTKKLRVKFHFRKERENEFNFVF
jgi:hypothetical protein